MSRPKASVTGASGGIGSRLARALQETHDVRGLFRMESEASRAWAAAGGEVVLGGLENEGAQARLMAGADLVVHCAARMTGFSPDAFFRVNVDGARAAARAAKAQRCRRFMHVSSIAVYGGGTPRDGAYVEDIALTEDPGLDSYTRSKLRGEQAVAAELGSGSTELTIVRPTCVYGPGIGSWTLVPLAMIRKGRPLIFGLDGGAGRLNVIFVEDLVRGIIAAASSPAAAGKVFNLGHEEVSYREFYDYLGDMVGRAPVYSKEKNTRKLGELAHRVSRWMAPAGELSRGIGMALRLSRNSAAHPSAAARAAFGFAPVTTLPGGMLATELGLRGGNVVQGEPRLPGASLPPRHPPLWNCDGHYAVRPAAVVRPRNEAELAAVVLAARREKQRLKAVGSRHAFAPLPDTEGVVVSLERMMAIQAVEGTLVTAQGGITIAEFNRQIARHGLALPTHGSFVEQTLAGAIATGTHGGGLGHGTLSDCVERIELVRADGVRVVLQAGDPDFGGAVVSLGLLGITASVAIRCVPEFFLQAEPSLMRFEEFVRDFDRLQRENEFMDARYYPQVGEVEILRMNRVDRPAEASPVVVKRPTTLQQRRMVSRIFKGLLRGAGATRSTRINAALVRKLLGTTYQARLGRADEILAFTDLSQGEPFPIDDLEFAVPYSSAVDALRALDAHFRWGGRIPVFFPLHLRCSRGGEQWMGANYGRDVCWLELWHYPPSPQLYAEVEAVLAPFGPRYHFGKLLPRTGAKPRVDGGNQPGPALNLPRLEEFRALRSRMDPEGVFLNDYVQRLLGLPG